MIRILDSRYWNGVVPADPDYTWIKGYIAKVSDGDYFTSPEFLGQYRAAEALFGNARSAWAFFKAVSDPKAAAKRYHEAMMAAGGYGKIPPLNDIEDKYAPKSATTINKAWIQHQEMEQLSGREVMVYSAGWYWDAWIAPFIPLSHPIYTRQLWESDPAPDTAIKGWPTGGVMVQTVLDWYAPGFKATNGDPLRIDISDVPEAVFNAWMGFVGPGPGPAPEPMRTLKLPQSDLDSLHQSIHEAQ